MRVAVICEYSGVVREAFRRRGHSAISFDLLPSEQDGPHRAGDITELPYEYWLQFDLAICHPPCTYLSNAGARHLWKGHQLNVERYEKGIESKQFFLYLVNLPINRICIENPIPSKVFDLPAYNQTVQPYQFGHPIQKKTCLWLKNLPHLVPTNIVEPTTNCHASYGWYTKGGKERQKNRAKTFEGIAEAMAEQWGKEE